MIEREDYTQKKYAYMKDVLSGLYKKHGYEQITIPMFVSYDYYTDFSLSEKNEEIKLIDGTGKILAIRPDATFQVLQTVEGLRSKQNEKYFYEAKVFRHVSADYRQDEINQAGVESFLEESDIVDADIINLAIKSLVTLGIDDIRLDLSHADFVYGLLEEIDEIAEDEIETAHRYIEQKNRDDLVDFLNRKKVSSRYTEKLIDVCMLYGDFEEVMKKAREIAVNDKMNNALDKIEGVYEMLKLYGIDEYVYLDLGFTNAMNYYSGIMFKIYSTDAGGEVINGGRYDRLAKKIASRRGACGFSLNLDLTAQILDDDREDFFAVDFILHTTEKNMRNAVVLAEMLRKCGRNVSLVHSDADRVVDAGSGRALSSADIRKILGVTK